MLSKTMLAAGQGLATSLVPGAVVACFGVDLVANMMLQAEMVYQIAAAYGLDLAEPARRGEVLAIFGLSLGAGRAMKVGGVAAAKAGLVFLKNIPVAGAVIGASTNAALVYALGHAACQFYEAKINPLNSQAALAASQAANEHYLEKMLDQQVIMDQILVHVALAGNPGKTWAQILPELQSLNLSPASLEAITAAIQAPPSLESLLNKLNDDFAIPLVAQCRAITQSDGIITLEETKIIETIAKKLTTHVELLQTQPMSTPLDPFETLLNNLK